MPSSETIMKKKQKMASACVNLINIFVVDDGDDDNDNSRNGNFIFFCLATQPSTPPTLRLEPLIHLFLVKFEMI